VINKRSDHIALFRWHVPKSWILGGFEGSLRTLLCQSCVFGALYGNLKEDRPILSASKM